MRTKETKVIWTCDRCRKVIVGNYGDPDELPDHWNTINITNNFGGLAYEANFCCECASKLSRFLHNIEVK